MRAVLREPFVVLPVRGIADGKSRLAPVLDAPARAAFNEWLLTRTLDTLQAWRGNLDACVVVSACERVGAIARRYGAHVIDQSADLNTAAGLGVRHAAERGASSVLVLPCDLPDVDSPALDALVDAAHGGDVTIAPDSSGTGTNALMMPARASFEFCFGADSFACHCDAAAARGSSVVVHRSPALAFDLDTPADYARWKATAAKPVL